jgi:SAM-dependent methyltransferase
MTTAAQEAFLREFHADYPAVTSSTLGRGRTADGRSSYEILRDRVAGSVRVLDLGCGDGFLLDLLVRDGRELAGVDLSAADLALARQRSSLAGVPLLEGRAQELPFDAGSFDACVSHMAFMLMADIDEVAAEVARVLSPGGFLACVLGGGPLGGEAYGVFRDLARRHLGAVPETQRIPKLGDRRTRNREGLDEILSPTGFAPVEWESVELDFGGPLDEVWSLVSATYDLGPIDCRILASLREDFFAEAGKIASADGIVPCGMTLNFATARLSRG